jgi:hypothetical protein
MKTIYVFGNPLVKKDSLPLSMIGRLRSKFSSLEFREFDTTEDLEERDLIIIDTIKGIKNVELIEDIGKIITDKVYSMHDFDLGQTLKLMKKAEMIDSVKILGIPMGMDETKAFSELCILIEKINK